MKKIFPSAAIVLAAIASTLVSCTKDDISATPEVDATFNTTLVNSNAWSLVTESKATSRALVDDDLMYGLFLYNPNSVGVKGTTGPTASSVSYSFNQVITTGSYTICGFTNKKYSSSNDKHIYTLTEKIPLTLSDIHLGSATCSVTASQTSYNVNVNALPIMAKLSVTITGVPSNVTGLVVKLTNQATDFTLQGEISGATQTQEITLTKGAEKDANGNYTWTASDVLVYPVSDDSETMPISVIASDVNNSKASFSTTTTYQCKKGKMVKLTAAYKNITIGATLTESPWSGDVINGTIDLGNPTIQ